MFASKKKEHVERERRPDVGIVYSDTSQHSAESMNLATYFCGLLATSGYSNLYMIGIDAHTGGPSMSLPSSKRILYTPRGIPSGGKQKAIEVPASDVTFAYLDKIQTCHVVVVTVNSNDMAPLKQQLVDMLDPKRQGAPRSVTIFSIQRGVRNASVIRDAFLGRKDVAVVECVVGFAVVPHPKTAALCPTVPSPVIIFERLSKEIEDQADGPLRLMESIDMEAIYDKTLTPYSWGVMVWECLFALNVIAGGALQETLLADGEMRLVLAAMLRESRQALSAAARGGAWRPSFRLISSLISPWSFEMLLVLPLPRRVLWCVMWLLGALPSGGSIISPGQLDLAEGRKTMVQEHLGELVGTGRRYSLAMPVCKVVLERVQKMEKGVAECVPGSGCGGPTEVAALKASILALPVPGGGEAEGATRQSLAPASLKESRFWLLRLLAIASLFPLAHFLLFHH